MHTLSIISRNQWITVLCGFVIIETLILYVHIFAIRLGVNCFIQCQLKP